MQATSLPLVPVEASVPAGGIVWPCQLEMYPLKLAPQL